MPSRPPIPVVRVTPYLKPRPVSAIASAQMTWHRGSQCATARWRIPLRVGRRDANACAIAGQWAESLFPLITEMIYSQNCGPAKCAALNEDCAVNDDHSGAQVRVPELSVSYRVRRRLKVEGKNLRSCGEGSQKFEELGRWYIVDAATNSIIETKVDLEALARKLGALRPSEAVARPD